MDVTQPAAMPAHQTKAPPAADGVSGECNHPPHQLPTSGAAVEAGLEAWPPLDLTAMQPDAPTKSPSPPHGAPPPRTPVGSMMGAPPLPVEEFSADPTVTAAAAFQSTHNGQPQLLHLQPEAGSPNLLKRKREEDEDFNGLGLPAYNAQPSPPVPAFPEGLFSTPFQGAEQLGYSGAQWPSYAWPSASGVPYGVYTGSQTSLQAPVPGQYAMSPLPAFAPNTPQAQVVPYVAVVNPYSPQFPQYYAAASMAYPGWTPGFLPGQQDLAYQQQFPGPFDGQFAAGPIMGQGQFAPNPSSIFPGQLPPQPPPPAGRPQGACQRPNDGQQGRRNGHVAPPGRPVKRQRVNYSGPVPECVNINKKIIAAKSVEGVIAVVKEDLERFDAVCMATALHALASQHATTAQYAAIFERPPVPQLMSMIGLSLGVFTSRNLANCLWALAKMSHNPGQIFLDAMVVEVGKKLEGCNAQNLANIAWAFATLNHNPGPELLEGIAKEAVKKLPEFTAQNISNLLYAYGKLEYMPQEFPKHASKAAQPILASFTPQALSNTVWALSKLDTLDEVLFEAIVKAVLHKLPKFNAQNVANTIWGFANLSFDPGQALWDAVAQNCMHTVHEYSPQNIANVLWSYAKMSKRYEQLLEAASLHAVLTMKAFQPQSVANFCWAYATLGVQPSQDCLRALVDHAKATLSQFSPQNISNTAWALATLQYKEPELMAKIAEEVSNRLASPESAAFSRQHLANLIWAYATLEVDPGPSMLKAVAKAMCDRVFNCNPQEISNTVWAFAKLRYYDASVMDTFANEAENRIGEFSQQNLANLAWAMGKLSHFNEGLLDAIANQATSMVQELSLQHVSNILWTYASFLHLKTGMTGAFVTEIRRRLTLEPFNPQQLSNLLWSLCIAELCTEDIWRGVMSQIVTLGLAPHELPEEALTQIYQSYLLMGVDQPGADVSMPEGLLEAAHHMWLESCKNVRISALHRDVARLLMAIDIPHTIEQLTEDRLFSVDIALPGKPYKKIAIEVDGPHHFTANTLQVTGEMLARQKLLNARGWAVISVPFFRWSGKSDAERIEWFKPELAKAMAAQADRGIYAGPPVSFPKASQPPPQPPPPAVYIPSPEVLAAQPPPPPGPCPAHLRIRTLTQPPPPKQPPPPPRPRTALPQSQALPQSAAPAALITQPLSEPPAPPAPVAVMPPPPAMPATAEYRAVDALTPPSAEAEPEPDTEDAAMRSDDVSEPSGSSYLHPSLLGNQQPTSAQEADAPGAPRPPSSAAA